MKTEKYEFSQQSNLIQIGNLIDDLHGVHVHLLKLQRRYYRIYGKYASFARICSHITKLKQRTKPHWNPLPSQVIQQVAKRIDVGYEKFFDNIKDRKAGITHCVWTGSYNISQTATKSLENAVVIRDQVIAEAYFNEWSQIMALSEPLDWESEWVAPEWRIGT